MIKETSLDNKKITLIQRQEYMYICYILTLVSLLIPAIFISNEEIKNSIILMHFANIFSSELINIENIALVSSSVDLYWKAKFILVWSIFTGFFIFIIMFYFYGKAYLCSLGYIKRCKKKYVINTIKNKGTDLGLYDFTILLIIVLLSIDFYYLGHFFTIEDGHTYSKLFKSNLSIFMFASLISLFFSIYAYVILEFIGYIRKLLK